jgi:TolB-like protein/DNA-binding winged helix-turn-helix (wHTH) protein/Tfp pilus assembly protein PilF
MSSSAPAGHVEPVRARVWRFSNCQFDELRRELIVDGVPVEMEAKPLEILRQLLLHPGEVVTKENLLLTVWPGTAVVDSSLSTAVSKLRKVMGNGEASVILTVPRIGYRMGVPVEALERERQALLPAPVIGPVASGRTRTANWAAILLLSVVAAVAGIALQGWRSRLNRQQIRSVAVLPLANMSGDAGQQYLADGMTEELINELSRVQALKVISRTSVMQYKASNKPLSVIARELGVDAVVEGAILRAGNRIRVTAELIDAHRDAHLWSQSYDRDLADSLNLQRDLALDISRQIHITLQPAEAKQLAGKATVDPHAHELYLRGRFFWNQRTPDALFRAADFFRQAIEADPHYAQAYAGLADTYADMVAFGDLYPAEGFRRATAAAQRAIELDPNMAEGHNALAFTRAAEWDWAGAQQEFERALELNPRYVPALYEYAFILSMWGRDAQATALARRALDLDPVSAVALYRSGRVYFHGRHYDEAERLYRRILQLNPYDQLGLYGIGMLYEAEGKGPQALSVFEKTTWNLSGLDVASALAASGRKEEARQRLASEVKRAQQENTYLRPGEMAEVYANLGDTTEAIRWLERGYQEHDSYLAVMKIWPRYDRLRGDPRFQELLRRINFPASR